jgi:hypothetical protein
MLGVGQATMRLAASLAPPCVRLLLERGGQIIVYTTFVGGCNFYTNGSVRKCQMPTMSAISRGSSM